MEESRSRSRSRWPWPGDPSPSRPAQSWVYDVTVDEGGVFHPRPNCRGGPFRCLTEATAAMRRKHFPGPPGIVRVRLYGETISFEGLPIPAWPEQYFTIECRMFHVHPNNLGGPFETLSDAMDAIQLVRLPPIPPLPKWYYLTLENGLFHVHPDGLGGPFKELGDASDAIRQKEHPPKPPCTDFHRVGRERMEGIRKMLSEMEIIDLTPATIPPQPGLHEKPAEGMCSSTDTLEPRISDPVLLEAIELYERMEEEEEIRNGMAWMQDEVTEAFEIYLSSIGTKPVRLAGGWC